MASLGGRPFARHLKVIDWLKAELASSLGAVLRAMVAGTEDSLAWALGSLVLTAYVLGRRSGLTYGRIDARVVGRARDLIEGGHELERTYGDLSALVAHFEGRGGADGPT
jgi:hypothetical protein